jgi:hypothetical protein
MRVERRWRESHRDILLRAAAAFIAIAAASLLAVASLGTPAHAVTTVYKDGNARNNTPYGGANYAYKNQAVAHFGGTTVVVSNGVFTSSAADGVTQSFASGRYSLSCKWYNKAWSSTVTGPLTCNSFY